MLIAALQLPVSGISIESFRITKNVTTISIESMIIPIVVILNGDYPKSDEFFRVRIGTSFPRSKTSSVIEKRHLLIFQDEYTYDTFDIGCGRPNSDTRQIKAL